MKRNARASRSGPKNWIKVRPLTELVSFVGLVGGFLIELHHITHTLWQNFFFSNSDMVTLPLVQQSLALKEPFHWVFSSQIFLFPEAIFYAFSALVTPNFRFALIVNAFLNCLLLYVLLRLIAGQFSVSRTLSQLYALGSVLFLLFLCFLEARAGLNVATFFLVTTAYYGVILAALGSIVLTIHYLNKYQDGQLLKRRQIWLLGSLMGIAFLTTLSNPLYIFQFIAPLLAVCCVALLLKIFSFRSVAVIAIPQLTGSLIGMIARKLFFTSFFSPAGSVKNYFHFHAIGQAAHILGSTVIQAWNGIWQEKLEIFIIIFAMVSTLMLLLVVIYHSIKSKHTNRYQVFLLPNGFLLIGMAALTPWLVIAGSIVTGNPVTRYFVPIIIFPLLALIPALKYVVNRFHANRFEHFLQVGLLSTVSLVLIIALISSPVASMRGVSDFYTPDERCLDRSIAGTQYRVGIAQYWRSRGLQLNSRTGIKVMQVQGGIARFTWLYNAADYRIYKPDFVIVDKIPAPYYDIDVSLDFAIPDISPRSTLGAPSHIYSCPSFYIYTYSGSKAQSIILDRLHNFNLGM